MNGVIVHQAEISQKVCVFVCVIALSIAFGEGLLHPSAMCVCGVQYMACIIITQSNN